ncbi:PP2C family protein-serine/threonine phosphatase [Candidatus Venteria ishoeyi]|uniref:PPM-type phosphatase domain-containing protein n=2 Tax=Candidatus Venteria ishoeyi TaxID=1899563 RepID=A0A1H6FCQ7_9GAMM|nr:protein phosphatase 2C domain-containing protein [Candidatus Venteria ishoeyi]SEH07858.1 Putative protein phosphatase 2C-type [Candidatus Venteria ishoeyi]
MIKFDFPIKQAHQAGREEQQDAVDCFYTEDKQRFLLVVADGMGGHKGGRLASAAVLETASEVWMESLQGMPNDPQAVLQDLCERAHKRINQVGKMHDLSPRSTVVLLYVDKDYAWWAHVGDSRLYHFRHEKLLFRTKDHSVVQMLVGLEQISEAEMANHPDQGRLLRWLGGEQFKGAEFGESALIPGDCFVLCSDGLWEYVDTDKMVYFLRHEVLDKSAGALLGLALKASQGEGG